MKKIKVDAYKSNNGKIFLESDDAIMEDFKQELKEYFYDDDSAENIVMNNPDELYRILDRYRQLFNKIKKVKKMSDDDDEED